MLADTPAHRAFVEWVLFASEIALEKALETFILVAFACWKLFFEGWVENFPLLYHFYLLEDCCKHDFIFLKLRKGKNMFSVDFCQFLHKWINWRGTHL